MPTNRHFVKEKVRTYAEVLLDTAFEAGGQNCVLAVRDQLERIMRLSRENMELSTALEDPSYSEDQRAQLVRGVFGDAEEVLVEVLAIMAERRDSALITRVWESYNEQLERKLDVTVVDVSTVVALNDHLRELIIKKTAVELGTKVVLREHLDPALIGGILMSANGKRIDASVLSQLESARNVLKLSTDGGEC